MKHYVRKVFDDEDSKEILAKGFSFLSVRTAGLLVGYLFTYFITINYGASVYGLVVLCFSLFLFCGIFGRLGLDINLVRYYSEESNMADTGLFYRVLVKSFLIASLIATILYFSRDLFIYDLFKKPDLEPYFIWMVMAIPFWSITLVCAGFLRARKQNKWFAFLNNPARFLFSLIVLLILYTLSDSPINVIKAHFFGVTLLAILAVTICTRIMKRISFRSLRNTWSFVKDSFPMMMSSTVLVLLGWMDTFVLGIYSTDDQIGIYGVALKIATLAGFVFQAINSILAPKLAALYTQENLADFRRIVRFATRTNFFATLMILVVIVILHKWLLSIFGPEFVAGSLVLLVLCFGQFITAFSGSVGVIMQMTGKQVVYQNIVLIALLLNVILNFTLTPRFGITGAAIATVLSIATWNLSCAIFIQRNLKIQSYFNPFN